MENLPTKDDFRDEYPNVGYNRDAYQKALEKWAKDAVLQMKKLEHHEATTMGLWATDRPDLIQDPKKIMFQIKDA